MSTILAFLAMIAAYGLIVAILAGLCVGAGFVLNAVVPSLQLGHAVITSCIIVFASLHYFTRLLNAIHRVLYRDDGDEDGAPEDQDVQAGPQGDLEHPPGRSRSTWRRKQPVK